MRMNQRPCAHIQQEFAGALLMFLVLWPFVGVFGNTWTAWIAHFFFVMLVRRVVLAWSSGAVACTNERCLFRFQPTPHLPFLKPPPPFQIQRTRQCDIISGGSQVNPSVSVAMFVHGAISFPGAVVRIVAQLIAGIAAYPLLCVRAFGHNREICVCMDVCGCAFGLCVVRASVGPRCLFL